MTLAVQGESVIMFMAPDADSASGISALWAVIAGMFVVSILLLRVGNSIFNREELLGSTVDRLNLRGTFGKIWRYARAVDEEGTPARNIIEWYRQGIPLSLRRFQTAIKITIAVFCFAFTAGLFISQTEQWSIPLPPESEASGSIENFEQFITTENQSQAVGFIITQNVRVLVGTFLLSIFSFGVAALLIPPLTSAILGYIVGIVIGSGYSPMFIISAILPHGIIEIPVLVIATGICLAAGSVVTRPPKGTTVGHAWITTLGHGLKIILGIIIPGLIIAALIESFITPHIVVMALGG
jgi:stage II sporulation protein M